LIALVFGWEAERDSRAKSGITNKSWENRKE
jgi:hypothetical protein